jgi:hypothetical protein
MNNADMIDAIVIDFSKAFDLVPHDRLIMKIAKSGVDSKVVKWVRELLLGRTHTVRIGGQLSEEVRVTSGVPQQGLLDALLFLAYEYVNDIWRNILSTVRLSADDCVIYKKLLIIRTLKSCRKIWTGWGNGRLKMR